MSLQITAGTTQKFAASGGTITHTTTSLAAGAGRMSNPLDLGDPASGRTNTYLIEATAMLVTAGVLGEEIRYYLMEKVGDNTILMNDDGAVDAAVSAIDKLNNLRYLGSIIVDEAVLAIPMAASFGVVEINVQNIHIVTWNATADAFHGTAANNTVFVTPITYSDV